MSLGCVRWAQPSSFSTPRSTAPSAQSQRTIWLSWRDSGRWCNRDQADSRGASHLTAAERALAFLDHHRSHQLLSTRSSARLTDRAAWRLGMQCPRCRAENREGRRFCGECGLSFASACPSCGFLNEGSEKFCGGCGKSLAAASTPAEARFTSPESYTPKHLAERNTHLQGRPRRRAQAGDGPLRRSQGLDGVTRGP